MLALANALKPMVFLSWAGKSSALAEETLYLRNQLIPWGHPLCCHTTAA